MIETLGTTFDGWTVVGSFGSVSPVPTTYIESGRAFPAHAGTNWLDLSGYPSDTRTGVQQAVSTVPGQTYVLDFYIGNISVSPYGVTSTVLIYVGSDADVTGVPTFVKSNVTPSSGLAWEENSITFTATAPTTYVSFLNGDPSDDNSNGIDTVSLTAVGTAVPAPAASALLAAALLLGTNRRRR